MRYTNLRSLTLLTDNSDVYCCPVLMDRYALLADVRPSVRRTSCRHISTTVRHRPTVTIGHEIPLEFKGVIFNQLDPTSQSYRLANNISGWLAS